MKKFMIAACLSLLAATSVYAADGKKAYSEKQLAQQQRMKDCNTKAKTKAVVGADRKAFMKTCLSANQVSAAPAAPAAATTTAEPADQKEKMKSCNADVKTKALKGEDRKAFMSSCLKG